MIFRICILVLTIFFFSPFSQSIHAQEADQLMFLVRHAEKVQDGSRDPELTEDGVIRAERLAAILKDFNIKGVFSTDYKRTRNTAQPLADMLGLKVTLYDPRDEGSLSLIRSQKGNLLIVGHSNSTPTLANKIIGEDKYEKLDESVYDHLFILARSGKHFGSQISKF